MVKKWTRGLLVLGVVALLYEWRPHPEGLQVLTTPTPTAVTVQVDYSLTASAPAGSQLVVHFTEVPQDIVVPVVAAGTTRQTLQTIAAGPVSKVSLTLTGPHVQETTTADAPVRDGRAFVGQLEVHDQKSARPRLNLPATTPVKPLEDPMPVPSESWEAKL